MDTIIKPDISFGENPTFYMIPETKQNKTIELYQCNEFPHKWEFLKTLMVNVEAVDSTLFEHMGKWWLFTNLVESIVKKSINKLIGPLIIKEKPRTNHPQ